MMSIDHLLTLSRIYAAAEGVSLSAVSWRVFGDTKKLPAMEGGADIQVRRYGRAVQWFADNWPNGAEWPPEIERPSPSIVPSQEPAAEEAVS